MSTPRASTLLLTGFEPFGEVSVNPTEQIVRGLSETTVSGHRVVGMVLPVVFSKAWEQLEERISKEQPFAVVCLGLAQNRRAITPERVAINRIEARICDNEGRQPMGAPVVAFGPVGYWSTLPLDSIVSAISARGMPCAVSDTAGTFVCNELFYHLMHSLASEGEKRIGGFIHVPPFPGQCQGNPGISITQMTEAIRIALECTVNCLGTREALN